MASIDETDGLVFGGVGPGSRFRSAATASGLATGGLPPDGRAL